MKNLEIREILLKRVTEIVANEVNEQQENFLLMLLGTYSASLPGDFWTRKAATGTREEFMRAGQFSNAGSWLDKCYSSIVFWK